MFTVAPATKTPATGDASETNEEFFRSTKYLTVSTQLHLEALAQAVGNVWTLSPTFRAEKSDTSRHLSEFYMLEAEMCFVNDMASVMDLVEDMLRSLSTNVYKSTAAQDLLHRSKQGANDLAPASEVAQRWEGLMKEAWPRITYTEAIDITKGARRSLYTDRNGARVYSQNTRSISRARSARGDLSLSPITPVPSKHSTCFQVPQWTCLQAAVQVSRQAILMDQSDTTNLARRLSALTC